jgi:hypothetical protein
VAIWDILCIFGLFFPRFGALYKEKSGTDSTIGIAIVQLFLQRSPSDESASNPILRL